MVLYSLSLLLFAGTVFLLYALASQMFNSRVGLLSALLFSLYPLSIYSISLPLDEHLFLPLWFLGLYLLFKEIRGEPVRGAVWWYGLLFGYATMTRTHTIFMPLVVAYAFLLIRCSWKKILSVVFIIFIIGQLINLPWIIRNYRQWRTYVPYTATFFTVYAANNPSVVRADNNGKIPEHGEEGYSPELVRAIGNYDVPTMEKLAKRETIRWIVRRPGSFLILGVEKVLHFMGTNRQRGIWVIDLIEEALKKQPSRQLPAKIKKSTEEMAFGAYYLVLYLFLFGLVWVSRNWKRRSQVSRHSLLVIGLCFLFYLAEHFIIYPERKYRFPLELLMLIVASAFINFLICDFKLFTKDRRFFCKPNRQC